MSGLKRFAVPLQIGVLGTAAIARELIRGVKGSHKVVVSSIASRNAGRAADFAREHGVARSHGSYEALLADSEVDIVYNPLPNSLHAEWSIRAAKAGKHVLCEKPLATSFAEAKSMFEAAQVNGVHLVEAYPYLSQPQSIELRRLLHEGVIGRVRLVRASFGFTMSDASDIRLDATLGGGSLLDAGSYPVSLVRVLSGSRPIRVHAVADWSAPGVDRSMVATLEHSSGLLAQISCSFGTAVHRHALIAGEAGVIETSYSNHTSADQPAVLQIKRGTSWEARYETVSLLETNGFLAEVESFADMITIGSDSWTGIRSNESIDVARTLEAIAASARSRSAVEL